MSNHATPLNQTKKNPKRPFSLKKVKTATHGLLSAGALTPKWPWGGKSPEASPKPASAPAGLAIGNPTKESAIDHLEYSQGAGRESSRSSEANLTPLSTSFEEKVPGSSGEVVRSSLVPRVSRGSQKSADTIPIAEITLTVAVDCSGSTRGRTLEAEKKAIRSISGLLSPQAQRRVVVLPWNDQAESTLTLDEMEELFGNGGTDPTTLLRDRYHRQALLNSSLWVLLTDGYIDQNLIEEFAIGIGTHGLHGTAAIVICTELIRRSPIECNISVGKSVFAIVPDCMFLFHDVETDNVYILQCKGRFKDLLPREKQDISLNYGTAWTELPRMSYDMLRNFDIPKPRELSSDTVLLQSGKTFDLNDVYNDTLDPSITDEILSHDDDLKTLLLTAATRGRKEDVKRWITKKKLQTSDPIWKPRPDLAQGASRTMEKLVHAIRNPNNTSLVLLKKSLQYAHEANWQTFAETISAEKEEARIRDAVISDAYVRLDLEDRTPSTPVSISPVSPALARVYKPPPQLVEHADSEEQSSESDTGHIQPSAMSGRLRSRPRIQPTTNHNDVDAIFTRGYKCRRLNSPLQSATKFFEGNCNLCSRSAQIMALILSKPEYEATLNFPLPQQHARHMFPFILGNLPDVDLVSPEIYCETCSVYLVHLGQSPKGDRVLGALPLVQTNGREYELNMNAWSETLDRAFEGRFDASIALSVFLSVLYNTLDDLAEEDSTESTATIKAIRWACENMLRSIQVVQDTATVPLGESPRAIRGSSSASLREAIPRLVRSTIRGDTTLLCYPLDGFLILMLSAKDIDHENCGRATLRCVTWLRIAYHMAEEHYNVILGSDKETATKNLFEILHVKDSEVKFNAELLLKKTAISLTSLEGTPLLTSDDCMTFRRMGTLLTQLNAKCEAATAVYLHYLLQYSSKHSSAMECFRTIRNLKTLRKVFVAPEEVELSHAATIIAGLYAPQCK